MEKRRKLTTEQLQEIQATRKTNKNKNIDTRLKAPELIGAGLTYKEISVKTGFAASYVGELMKKYITNGIGSIAGNNYKGNHRLLTFKEEAQLLEPFIKQAEKGQLVSVGEIKKAYVLAVGKEPGSNSHIYEVLKRHNFRKVMPRSKHPNKACDEVIHITKKLKQPAKKRCIRFLKLSIWALS